MKIKILYLQSFVLLNISQDQVVAGFHLKIQKLTLKEQPSLLKVIQLPTTKRALIIQYCALAIYKKKFQMKIIRKGNSFTLLKKQ